jgi:hypothetical protein
LNTSSDENDLEEGGTYVKDISEVVYMAIVTDPSTNINGIDGGGSESLIEDRLQAVRTIKGCDSSTDLDGIDSDGDAFEVGTLPVVKG